ncbi:iron-siderophore ABC transporter substrate-binding protein [Pseudonocardia phyllosphaerae]|uniref:iron-siderophore ABC transporter substrate-binding protein n=1 Tax=Pseudonocardia phyllosphaerae TaxID=3390502 RepID=UPI00397C48C2
MRARLVWGLLAAVLFVAGAACGTGGSESSGSGGASPGFPATVTHKLGSTTVPAPPQRVVTVGLRDADFALALGVKPVGVAQWFEGYPNGRGPWAEQAAAGSTPQIVATADGPNLEAIAALHPDLILNVYSTTDKAVYDKLSQIAPTVNAPPNTEDYALSWQEQFKQTGAALGKPDEAARITADVEGRIAQAKAAHPEFQNKTIVYGGLTGDPGVYTSTDQRGRFLTALGFRVPPEIDSKATADSAFFASLSPENFALLDTDVAILIGPTNNPTEATRLQPLYRQLRNVQQGRAIFLDELRGQWSGALSFNSPLSLPYVLDTFVPALSAAADGNPATPVPTEPAVGPAR